MDILSYLLSKKYTDNSIAGGGISAGKNCVVDSITDITGGHRVTFKWTLDNGTVQTGTMDVMDGQDGSDGAKGDKGDTGLGIKSVAVNAEDHLIITYDDDTTQDAGQIQVTAAVDSVNGKTGEVTLSASDVGALPDDTAIPSKTSDLTNDSNFVADASYVHTDNNYDATAKGIVDGVTSALADKVDKVQGKGLSTNDYTDADKAEVAKVADKADAEDVIDGASYDSANHLILFKNGTTTLFSLDAAAFVKDGMVDNVEITGGNLVITFNTDAGKQAISIPLTDIFDPANYYTKTATDGLLADKVSKSNTAGLLKNDGTVDTTVAHLNDVNGEIPANADLNDYTTVGNYYVPTGAVAASLSNAPIGTAFSLEVTARGTGGGVSFQQTVKNINSANDFLYYRTKPYDSAWGAWRRIANNTDIAGQQSLLKDTVGWTGKNLYPYKLFTQTRTINGVTFTNNGDGTITVTGTASDDANFNVTGRDINGKFIIPNGEYIVSGCPSGGSTSSYFLAVARTSGGAGLSYGNDTGNGLAVTVNGDDFSQDNVHLQTTILIKSGYEITTPLVFKPMIRRADISDSTYEPYHESVEVMYEEEIHGVNLLQNTATTRTVNGVTFTVNADGTVTANGTATNYVWITVHEYNGLPVGKYIMSGCPSGGGVTTYRMKFRTPYPDASINVDDEGNGRIIDITQELSEKTLQAMVGVESGVTVSNLVFKPMLRKADIEDSTYRPYNPQSIQHQLDAQGVLGAKNLNVYPYVDTSKTSSGVTFTDLGDGTVKVNGTATENVAFNCHTRTIGTLIPLFIPNGRYIISGCPSGGSTDTYLITAYITKNASAYALASDYGNGREFIVNGDDTYTDKVQLQIQILIKSGTTVNNLVFKPMLRLASDPDSTYQPYAMTNRELTEKLAVQDLSSQIQWETGYFSPITNSCKFIKYNGKYMFRLQGDIVQATGNEYIKIAKLPFTLPTFYGNCFPVWTSRSNWVDMNIETNGDVKIRTQSIATGTLIIQLVL